MATYDIVVIGGGLVGAAIAYGVAAGQRRVAMVDEGDVAYRAARGNFGLIWVQGKGMGLPAYAAWTRLSARRWPELAAQLRDDTAIDVGLVQTGGLRLLLSEHELIERQDLVRRFLAQPGLAAYRFEILDRSALVALLPSVGPDVVGASYCPCDGHVNPLKLLRALHEGFRARGGRYLPDHAVKAIASRAGEFAIATARGTINTARLVVAAGLGSSKLASMVGLTAPVHPQRGQIIVLERIAPFLPLPVETLRQTDEGTVLIGDSHEEVGFDESTSNSVLSAMAERAVRAFPHLREVHVYRSWAALRILSPDGFPIYDHSAPRPGAFVATSHSGVTLAAAHALELAPQIAARQLSESIDGRPNQQACLVRVAAHMRVECSSTLLGSPR